MYWKVVIHLLFLNHNVKKCSPLAVLDLQGRKEQDCNTICKNSKFIFLLTDLWQEDSWFTWSKFRGWDLYLSSSSFISPSLSLSETARHDGNIIDRAVNPQLKPIHQYNFDLLKPYFYIVKLGFTGVYIIFYLCLLRKHRLWILVSEAVLTSTHNLCFEQKYEKWLACDQSAVKLCSCILCCSPAHQDSPSRQTTLKQQQVLEV